MTNRPELDDGPGTAKSAVEFVTGNCTNKCYIHPSIYGATAPSEPWPPP